MMAKRAEMEIGVWLAILAALALSLAGCGPKTYRDRIVTVKTPVSVPCALERPAPVASLKDAYPEVVWASMDTRQKAAAVGKQVLDRQAYGEQLNAATAGCE